MKATYREREGNFSAMTEATKLDGEHRRTQEGKFKYELIYGEAITNPNE